MKYWPRRLNCFPEIIKPFPIYEGYNALIDEYFDMLKSGILDPIKVTRSALERADSIAAMLLTTEAIIVDIPEEKSAAPMPDGMDY